MIEVGLITARFMHFAAVMALFGLALFPLYAYRPSAGETRPGLGGVIMARSNREIAARVIEVLDIRPNDRVLEVGFRPGIAIELVVAELSSGKVVGIDCSEVMMDQAKTRNATSVERGRVELRLGSVEAMPFSNDTFDKALAINSMQVWPDAVAGLREIQRVLKSGGSIGLGFTPYSGQAKAGLTEALVAAGFAGAHILP